jgi:hypothetical protein
MPEEIDVSIDSYALPATIRGSESLIQLLPGPDCIPREGWLNQHHAATRRPGRAMPHQLHVNHIEDRDSITLVGEERIEGADLGSLVRTIGPRSPEEAGLIAGRIAETLRSLEHRVGSCAVWWLPPENVLLVTGARSLTGSRRLIERKGGEFWEEVPLKLRLHQTAATLRKGVSMPRKVRELSQEPGKKFPEVRREAVALPMLFFLLTARRFRWRKELSHQAELPSEIANLFERVRIGLVEDPESVDSNLFEEFPSVALRPGEEVETAGDQAGEELREDGFEDLLQSTLYQEEVELDGEGASLPPVEEPKEKIRADAVKEGDDTDASEMSGTEPESDEAAHDEENEFEEEEERRAKWSWLPQKLWLALWAVVLALVVGYFLSGWSEKKGPATPQEIPEFPAADYSPPKAPGRSRVLNALEEFLIERGLADLVLGVREEEEGAWREVEDSIARLAEDGDAGAARFRALLSITGGGTDSESVALLEKAARLGDPEAQFLLVRWHYDSGSEEVRGEEISEMLERSAALGHVNSQVFLAALQAERGDLESARRSVQPAVRKRDPSAIYQLVLLLVNSADEDGAAEGADRFREAAAMGDVRAMYAYGRCLEFGFGLEASSTEARRWMNLAASLGHQAAARWIKSREGQVDAGE